MSVMRFSISIILCFFVGNLYASQTISGNLGLSGETVSFLFDKHVQDRLGLAFGIHKTPIGQISFFGATASAAGLSNEFALSVISRGQSSLTGIARPEITIDGQQFPNPLYNSGIVALDIMEGTQGALQGDAIRPVVVIASDPSTLYLVNQYTGLATEVIPARSTPDAAGAVTSGILNLAAADNYAFAVVKPNAPGSLFGDLGSGVDIAILGTKNEHAIFQYLDAQTGQVSPSPRAIPLDRTTSFVAIGNPLASIGQVIDMYWDFTMQRFFIALQVVGGAGATDGAKAVVVGRLNIVYDLVDGKKKPIAWPIILTDIAPNSAFDATNDKIVGAMLPNVEITINKVRTMQMSTLVTYLIVQGNVGSASVANNVVYALPLVTNADDESLNGTIAKKNSTPIITQAGLVVLRDLKTPAVTPTDMPLVTDAAVEVGAGPLLAGPITDVVIRNDTVFATVREKAAGFSPGIYASTALFDENGLVKGWTEWKRAATSVTEVGGVVTFDGYDGALLDPANGDLTLMARDSANHTVLKKSVWGSGGSTLSQTLINTLNQEFATGIIGLFDIPYTGEGETPGLRSISLLVATGDQKIALVQTGNAPLSNANIIPSVGSDFDSIIRFSHGDITTDFPTPEGTKIITIAGGELSKIGIIQAAEVMQGGAGNVYGYIVVGGMNGVAILSRPDGSGWLSSSALLNDFQGLVSDMNFKALGNYASVRKLMYDAPYLYVLTDTALDRIDCTQGNIGLGTGLSITRVADAQQLGVIGFNDFFVTSKFGLLGTTGGLFRVGNDADISTASSTSSVFWTFVALPDGAGPVTHLLPLAANGRPQTMGTTSFGGMVYVVSAYRGNDSAQLHRFSVSSVAGTPVGDTTLQRIQDLFKDPIPSYFVDFSSYIRFFTTDGALFYFGVDGSPTQSFSLKSLPALIGACPKTGLRFLGYKSQTIPLNLTIDSYGTGLIKNSAAGSFILAGSFGLYVHE